MDKWRLAVIAAIVLIIGGSAAGVAAYNHAADVRQQELAAQKVAQQQEQAREDAAEAAQQTKQMQDLDAANQKALAAIHAHNQRYNAVAAKWQEAQAHPGANLRYVPSQESADSDQATPYNTAEAPGSTTYYSSPDGKMVSEYHVDTPEEAAEANREQAMEDQDAAQKKQQTLDEMIRERQDRDNR